MGATAAVHPADPILQAYGLGKLDDVSSASVSKHLERCDSCQRRVAELSSDEFLGRLQNAQVKADKATSGWSPSASSSTEGAARPIVPPPPVDTLPPELVDHPDYEIVRELGRGGMGVVYLVKNRLMGRLEVLKVIGRHLVERPGVVDRFLREIRSAAKLQHPNIVTAYTAMRLGESLALSMEYVDGLDLARTVKAKGPLPVVNACYFINQAALGLQHAHERGMVHRDIKPANLILARDGKKAIVKVLDFGLAKVTIEGQVDAGLTREGQMLGTPDYIAPEQIRNAQSADIRADIYSLGCTFYYLLTGGPPFRGDHLWDVYQAHFSMDAQPLNLARPEVPVELAAVVAKMMAKEPGRRFQTPGEVARALTPFFKKSSESARSSSAEMSALERREEKLGAAGPLPTTDGPSTTPVTSDPAEKRTETSRVEETAEPAAVIAAPQRRKPRWLWPAVAAAGLLLGCALTWGMILRFKTPNGSIGPERLPAHAEVLVHNAKELPKDRGPVEPTWTANKDVQPRAAPATQSASSPTPPPQMPASFTSSIGMTLKLIPAGEFTMGSRDDDAEAEKDEKPAHPVNISGFYMGIQEVTQAQYQEVMGINPSYFSSTGGGKNQVAGRPTDSYPVEYVTWLDAVRFCNALSQRDGLPSFYEINGETVENVEIPNKKGPGYRLPAEAEWEYACRAGTDTKYSFGNDPALLSDYGWFDQNSVRMSHPVGEKRPNAFGLYDMHGNVFERCADLYDDTYYKRSPTDDPLRASGTGARLIRGGSWLREPRWSRSSRRAECSPIGRYGDNGFRVVLNPSDHINVLASSVRAGTPPRPNLSSVEPKSALKPNIDIMSESTRMPFALIKPGEFMMGSQDDDVAANHWEKPPHKVRITTPFYLGIYEVTQAQYKAVTGSNPSFFSSTGGGREMVGDRSTVQYPVENVSWLDAVRFCNALSKKDGLPSYYQLKADKVECLNIKGTGYRLPTDAEWEYACRAGTTTRFYAGNDPWILNRDAWIGGSAGGTVHPVGQKQPKGFGLHDMHGNVWEWCSDWADGAYYKQSPTNDPPGASKGTHRVMRGGCWRDEPQPCRSANVSWGEPAGRWETVGFRVARTLSAAETASMKTAPDAPTKTAVGTPANKPVAALAATAPAPLAKGLPEEQLKSRGLIRSGAYFVVASEAEALDKFQEISPLIKQLDQAFRKYAQVLNLEFGLAVAEENLRVASASVDAANTDLSKMPNGARTNSADKQAYEMQQLYCANLTSDRDVASRVVDALRAQQPAAGLKEELAKGYTAKWADFLKEAPPVLLLLEKAKEEHRKLQGDPAVREALAAIRRSTKAEVTFSSPKNLQNGIDIINSARRDYSPEMSAPKSKPTGKSAKAAKSKASAGKSAKSRAAHAP
jgi:formylglycine-generating enzyme required for sulfatase activity/serine/threonine protein kinase